MPNIDGTDGPIWAAAKARQNIDIVTEVSRTLASMDLEMAQRPIGKFTEVQLEAEQLRLEELLDTGTITVDDFRRLQEVDYYLENMRHRRGDDSRFPEWGREALGE